MTRKSSANAPLFLIINRQKSDTKKRHFQPKLKFINQARPSAMGLQNLGAIGQVPTYSNHSYT